MAPSSLRLRLRRAIERGPLTRAEWCDDTGIPSPTLSRILMGDRTPTLRQATEIERVTGIPAGAWLRNERAA